VLFIKSKIQFFESKSQHHLKLNQYCPLKSFVFKKSYISHFVRDDIHSFRLSGGGWLAALPPTNPHPPRLNIKHCHSERSEEYTDFYRTTIKLNIEMFKTQHIQVILFTTKTG